MDIQKLVEIIQQEEQKDKNEEKLAEPQRTTGYQPTDKYEKRLPKEDRKKEKKIFLNNNNLIKRISVLIELSLNRIVNKSTSKEIIVKLLKDKDKF